MHYRCSGCRAFVISPDGIVAAKRVGPVDYTWLTSEIEDALRTLEES
jgi:hypothetical protein